jgi:hypothetical protein
MEVMVVVDRARRDALDVGLLHDGGERLLGQAPRLEQAGEVGALAQLRNAQLDGAGPRLPEAITITIALREPLGALLAVAGPGQAGHLQLHQPFGRKADHLAQEIAERDRQLVDVGQDLVASGRRVRPER